MADGPDESIDHEALEAALDDIVASTGPEEFYYWYLDKVAELQLGDYKLTPDQFSALDADARKEMLRAVFQTGAPTGFAELDRLRPDPNPESGGGVRYLSPTVAGFTIDPEPIDDPTVELDPEPMKISYRPGGEGGVTVDPPGIPLDPGPDTPVEKPPCWDEEQALAAAQSRLGSLEAELAELDDPQSATFQATVRAIRSTKEEIDHRERQLAECRQRTSSADPDPAGFFQSWVGRAVAAVVALVVLIAALAIAGVFGGGDDDPEVATSDPSTSEPATPTSGGGEGGDDDGGDDDGGGDGEGGGEPEGIPAIVSAHPCDLLSAEELAAATGNAISEVERLEDTSWSTCVWHSAPGPFASIQIRIQNKANAVAAPDDALMWVRSNADDPLGLNTVTVSPLGFGFIEEIHILRSNPTTIVGPDGLSTKEVEGFGEGWATTHCADADSRLGITIHGNAYGGARSTAHPRWYGMVPQSEEVDRALRVAMATVYDGLVALQEGVNQGGAGCPINDAPPPPPPDPAPGVSLTTIAVPSRLTSPGQTAIAVLVKNTGNVAWTAQTFSDQTFGDVLGGAVGPDVNTCGGDWGLAPGGTWQCAFFVGVTGPGPRTQSSTATITVADADGNMATSNHVNLVDLDPAGGSGGITVTKSPGQSQLPAEGGEVFFSVTIENGTDRTVAITRLIDTEFGDLLDPAAPFTYNDCLSALDLEGGLGPQGFFSCSFSALVEPPADGGPHENTVAVEVSVDGDVLTVGTGSATISFE